MSPLMEQAFARASQLPEVDQELFASLMLIEMDSGPGWAANFASPETAEILTRMANQVLAKPLRDSERSARAPGFLDLYDLLQKIKERQRMYLGTGTLTELEYICYGYTLALTIHQIDEFGTDFIYRFSIWLSERYSWGGTNTWTNTIGRISKNDQEALRKFFELLDDFKNGWDARVEK